MSRSDDGLEALAQGTTTEEALVFFDALLPVTIDEIRGRWRGREIDTGHPLNGLLGALGWYGKQFDDAETVHPLLFEDARGEIFVVDPRKVPMGLAPHAPRTGTAAAKRALSALRSVMGTKEPKARIRLIEHRGSVTAAMIYDDLPIIDVFRRVDENTLLGLMDMRGVPPFFFSLHRSA
jgi:hypothetical protein